MIPTRDQIQEQIDAESGTRDEKRQAISSWLDGMSCPADDKTKIMDDLITYDNY